MKEKEEKKEKEKEEKDKEYKGRTVLLDLTRLSV